MTIRYYPKFLWVIPVLEVGYQCVTHPFALHNRSYTIDLHALNTPPAFILSQDQTLICDITFIFSILQRDRRIR